MERRLRYFNLILKNYNISSDSWELDPFMREALAVKAKEPHLFDSMGDIRRLEPIFYQEVYPHFVGPLLAKLQHQYYLESLGNNLIIEVPELQSNVEHYIGEYDPIR